MYNFICSNAEDKTEIHRRMLESSDTYRFCDDKFKALFSLFHTFYDAGAIAPLDSKEIVREELAVGSDMHQGYYCPSPVLDMIIGGIHRGKLLKRPNVRSSPTHRYIYGKDGLHSIYYFYEGRPAGIEYLTRCNDRQYSFRLDTSGTLVMVTEELYDRELLRQVVWVYISAYRGLPGWSGARVENYSYDGCELSEWRLRDITRGAERILDIKYKINRKDGYIESWDGIDNPSLNGTARFRRLAKPPFLVP